MLPKNRRLSFKGISHKLSKAKRINGKYSSLLLINEEEKNLSQFAIVISSKISKKAVKRNQIKRQISSIIREMLTQIDEGFKAVLLVKKSAADASFQELEKSTIETFKKSGLLKNTFNENK